MMGGCKTRNPLLHQLMWICLLIFRIVILFLLRIFMHPDMKIYFVFGYLAELHIFHLKPIFEVH